MKVLLVSEGKHEESGALAALVRRIAPKIESCDWGRASDSSIVVQRGKGQGFFKRAVSWIRVAQKRGYDALVLVIDEDGYHERIRDLDKAQEDSTIPFPRALGTAIRSFDAWILADETALSTALENPVSTQTAPEETRNPKAICAELLQKSACWPQCTRVLRKGRSSGKPGAA